MDWTASDAEEGRSEKLGGLGKKKLRVDAMETGAWDGTAQPEKTCLRAYVYVPTIDTSYDVC